MSYCIVDTGAVCDTNQHVHKTDSTLVPSQWETVLLSQWETLLQSNAVSHWLGKNQESALCTEPELIGQHI